ncbi:hypothetical protein EYF80_031529 [Liparis tanakae]|uniref:Uncharacterized protein n=1 Tax=Liparis tanakae TaxID=230148 RepID=A0A4Z2GX49_9TELE|nr:hypothetical protein EYF80_031529 [Liparis tanakae]
MGSQTRSEQERLKHRLVCRKSGTTDGGEETDVASRCWSRDETVVGRRNGGTEEWMNGGTEERRNG